MDNRKKQPRKINRLKVVLALLLVALAVEAVLIVMSRNKSADAHKKLAMQTEEAMSSSSDVAIDDTYEPSEMEEIVSVDDAEDHINAPDKDSSTKRNDALAKNEDKKPNVKVTIPEPDNKSTQGDAMANDDVTYSEPDDNVLQREDHAPEVIRANRPFEPRGTFRKFKPPF